MPRILLRDGMAMGYQIDAPRLALVDQWWQHITPLMLPRSPETGSWEAYVSPLSVARPGDPPVSDWVQNTGVMGWEEIPDQVQTGAEFRTWLRKLRGRLDVQLAALEGGGIPPGPAEQIRQAVSRFDSDDVRRAAIVELVAAYHGDRASRLPDPRTEVPR